MDKQLKFLVKSNGEMVKKLKLKVRKKWLNYIDKLMEKHLK